MLSLCARFRPHAGGFFNRPRMDRIKHSELRSAELLNSPKAAWTTASGFEHYHYTVEPPESNKPLEMEIIKLSPLELEPISSARRMMPRPPNLRQPDYEDKYDFLTIFYDCFSSIDGAWKIFVGPPLLNLETIVLPALPAAFRCSSSSDVSLRHLVACTQLWLRTVENHAVLPPGRFQQVEIKVQPNESDLFRGRKVLLTKSKDNDLDWIHDWVHFFAHMHGSDAVLFYDNASTRYDISQLCKRISSVPGIEVVVVVRWPYKFGPVGSESFHGPQGLPWDSNYSQYGILEHARHRFLGLAEAVVNADVDELIISKSHYSVFEILGCSDTGYLEYPGYWIESATESVSDTRSHFDFEYRFAVPELSDPKWTVAPRRCPPDAQWGVHQISGMQADVLSSEVSFRHFRAISTSWKYPRDKVERPNELDYVKDDELATLMRTLKPVVSAQLGWSSREHDGHEGGAPRPRASEQIVVRTESQGDAEAGIMNTLQKTLRFAKSVLPSSLASWAGNVENDRPAVGGVRFGDLANTVPIDDNFGFGRGTPVDRFYIESFLDGNCNDIAGRVLEVDNATYSLRFGAERVTRQDVLHLHAGHPQATIVGDLSTPGVLPRYSFDCIVLTQTLQFIYDSKGAVAQLHAALKPGGVLLVTVPGISQIDRAGGTWYWTFSRESALRLFAEVFGAGSVSVESHGNVFAAMSLLQGLALEEVPPSKLLIRDEVYPVIVTVRARKSLQDASGSQGARVGCC